MSRPVESRSETAIRAVGSKPCGQGACGGGPGGACQGSCRGCREYISFQPQEVVGPVK